MSWTPLLWYAGPSPLTKFSEQVKVNPASCGERVRVGVLRHTLIALNYTGIFWVDTESFADLRRKPRCCCNPGVSFNSSFAK